MHCPTRNSSAAPFSRTKIGRNLGVIRDYFLYDTFEHRASCLQEALCLRVTAGLVGSPSRDGKDILGGTGRYCPFCEHVDDFF